MKKMFHNSPKSLLLTMMALVLVFSTVIITPVEASAKVTYTSSSSQKKSDTRYFKDVKKKTTYRAEIEWLANKGAFKGIAKKGGKFKPSTNITRRQVGMIFDNLYGNRIDITIKDPNKKATQKFMTDLMTKVSKQLGYQVDWKGGSPKAKVTRAKACYYLRSMMKCAEGALDPK